jgi:hypothetical protein
MERNSLGILLPLGIKRLRRFWKIKGYYQPDYQFTCMVNGESQMIIIPALKY